MPDKQQYDRIFLVPPESSLDVRDTIKELYRALISPGPSQYPLLNEGGQLVLGEKVGGIGLKIIEAVLFEWQGSAICPTLDVGENRARCLGVYSIQLFDILDKKPSGGNDRLFVINPSQTEIVVANQGLPAHDLGFDVNYSGSSIIYTAQTFFGNPITNLRPLEKR